MATLSIPSTKYKLHGAVCPSDDEPLGMLLVWEEPKADARYVIGVDTSDGVGQDRSAIVVNRVGTATRPDELVAEWVGNTNPLFLVPMLYALGKWYAEADGTDALLCIECNRGDGRMIQAELMRRYGYGNFYRWQVIDRASRPFTSAIGWVTNVSTRQQLCTLGIQQIKQQKWKINSKWFVEELADFEYNAVKGTMAAAVNKHDDRVMAGLIALRCSHDWEFDAAIAATTATELELQEGTKIREYQAMAIAAADVDLQWGDGLYY